MYRTSEFRDARIEKIVKLLDSILDIDHLIENLENLDEMYQNIVKLLKDPVKFLKIPTLKDILKAVALPKPTDFIKPPKIELPKLPNPFRGKREVDEIVQLMKHMQTDRGVLIFGMIQNVLDSYSEHSLQMYKDVIGEDRTEFEVDNYDKGLIQFTITFFRSLDPTSLYLWKNKRMTGLNVSWHFETEAGNTIDVTDDHNRKDGYKKANKSFKKWINLMAQTEGIVETDKFWDALKVIKRNIRSEYYD